MKTILENEWPHNTVAYNYVVDVVGKVRSITQRGITPSKRVVLALQAVNPKIMTHGFRKNVLNAIFEDAIASELFDDRYRERLLTRLNRRWGKERARRVLIERFEILDCWRNRDARFVPDAYLIDPENNTVVCYEVEDRNPLNPFSIREYGAAWWTLEYIYWDLHLIAYDVYGNPRIVAFPESDFVAEEIRKTRTPPPA